MLLLLCLGVQQVSATLSGAHLLPLEASAPAVPDAIRLEVGGGWGVELPMITQVTPTSGLGTPR